MYIPLLQAQGRCISAELSVFLINRMENSTDINVPKSYQHKFFRIYITRRIYSKIYVNLFSINMIQAFFQSLKAT